MRGILYGLLLSNVLYLAWGSLVERNQQNIDAALSPFDSTENFSSLVLVSEADPVDLLQYPSAVLATESLPLAEDSSTDLGEIVQSGYCAEIGPFLSEVDAGGFVETNSARLPMTIEVRAVPAPPDYRVFIPPFTSLELATSSLETLRTAFAERGLVIDSFLVPRGELANSIALGLFSEQANALNVQSQLQKLGYTVVVRTEEKSTEEIWIVVSEVESEAAFMQHWSEIQLSRSYIHAGEKLC